MTRQFVLLYSIEMHFWKLHDFSLDLLEKKLSLIKPSQEEDKLAFEDWLLMRLLKSEIYRRVTKDYTVSITSRRWMRR